MAKKTITKTIQKTTKDETRDDKDQTLPASQGEKERPEKPGKGSRSQNAADRP